MKIFEKEITQKGTYINGVVWQAFFSGHKIRIRNIVCLINLTSSKGQKKRDLTILIHKDSFAKELILLLRNI